MNFSATHLNDLNVGKLLVNTSLFTFVSMFALKLDKTISRNKFLILYLIYTIRYVHAIDCILGDINKIYDKISCFHVTISNGHIKVYEYIKLSDLIIIKRKVSKSFFYQWTYLNFF